MENVIKVYKKLKDNISSRVLGKDDTIDKCIVALLCEGHLLLNDIPGTAKTTLAKSIAQSIGGKFSRVQFNPDLLPSDITGICYYNQQTGNFMLRRGSVFSNILLADEINRATPRTQSSLLECMEEYQTSIDGKTLPLERPFFVIATQNPIESLGTYPLPEAQLDRFFMCLTLGYPEHEVESEILKLHSERMMKEPLNVVISKDELKSAQLEVSTIDLSNDVREYILSLVELTRNHKDIKLGISTRGAISLMKASQGVAAIRGRKFICPEDVQYVFSDVVSHRIVLNRNVSISKDKILQSIMDSVEVPR